MKPQPQKTPRREPSLPPRIQKGELPPFPPLEQEDLEVIPGGKLDEEKKTEDEQLVLQAQGGDTQAMDKLLKKYHNIIAWHVSKKISNRAIVDEVIQDVKLKAWQKIHTIKTPKHFSSWVSSIARNLAINKLIYKSRRPKEVPTEDVEIASMYSSEDYTAPASTDPELVAIAAEKQAQIDRAMESLPPMQRKILELSSQGFSMKEISERTGIKPATVKTRVYRAREKLNETLDKLQRKSA